VLQGEIASANVDADHPATGRKFENPIQDRPNRPETLEAAVPAFHPLIDPIPEERDCPALCQTPVLHPCQRYPRGTGRTDRRRVGHDVCAGATAFYPRDIVLEEIEPITAARFVANPVHFQPHTSVFCLDPRADERR
jgi:hypothetical protein